ncbi:MAG TPA: tetratricopeptide repeat protein [Rhizomicrobium sp.]|nr:tetratricopeptide repeat protein [Rhizomicrobium sp.]
MSDIFREVEEEVRRDRLEKIWKQYGDYIVAAAALVILAAAAFRLWNVYEARERAAASVRYQAAQQLLQAGQSRSAAEAFAKLAKTAPGGYAKLSQLQEADALQASGNTAAALANYRKLAADSDEMISSIAKLRAAWIIVEGAPKSEVESMIGGMAADSSPWHQVAREILAYADYHAGDTKQALAEYRALSKDPKAPGGVRGRSLAMVTFLTAGGDKDVGKPLYPELPGTLTAVPKPGVPTAPANGAQAAPAPSNPPAAPANTTSSTPANASSPAPAETKGSTPK